MQEQDRLAVFLSYLGFVGLLPPYIAYFFLAETRYARFHARQGIWLTFVFLIGLFVLGISKLVVVKTGWNIRYLYAFYGLWFCLYIFFNLLAAIFGLLGRKWGIPGLDRWIKEPDVF